MYAYRGNLNSYLELAAVGLHRRVRFKGFQGCTPEFQDFLKEPIVRESLGMRPQGYNPGTLGKLHVKGVGAQFFKRSLGAASGKHGLPFRTCRACVV